MDMLTFLVSAVLLVIPSAVSSDVDLQGQVDALATKNEYLLKTVERLERRLTKLEHTEPKHDRERRQYDGPWTFSYRRDPTRVTLNRNAPIVFGNMITDLGGGYNNQTGIYTAPEAGLYMITCSVLADHGTSSNAQLHSSIVVDGVARANVFAYSEGGHHRDQGANTIFVKLNQGSRVWVKVIDLPHITVGGDMYSTFSGHLLWKE